MILMITIASLGIVTIGESAEKGKTSCSMNFTLQGWSAVYQTATGAGTITCDNGQSARVALDVKGGGITAGKRKIEKGEGKFSEVSNINELFGPYVKAEAHAGAVKSATALVMTKGEVSLALSGVGEGVDLGIAFGRMTIKRAGGGKK
ncbi:MAG: hypothetical protein ACM34I_10145 [bacterium]